jgi:hypothetical protein
MLWVHDGYGVFARISYDHESARQLTNETGGTQENRTWHRNKGSHSAIAVREMGTLRLHG